MIKTSVFLTILTILVSIFIIAVLSNYDINWMHPEVAAFHIPYCLDDGIRFGLRDFLKCFDSWKFDFLNSRARFFSHLFQIINLKFRVWLFGFLPPHPSLSLTWIFSLIFSPFFLFKLVRNISSQRIAAWIAVLLYLASPGFLSQLVLLFHPGKPLVNFFTIFCLYLASEIWLCVKNHCVFFKKGRRLYYLLLFTMFIAFISDESAFFIFFCIPLIFREIFFTGYDKNNKMVSLSYRAVFLGFLVFVTFVAPVITRNLGFGNFDFWDYIKRGGTGERYYLWKSLEFGNIFLNGHYLFSSHIVPFHKGDLSRFLKLDLYIYILFLFYCIYAYRWLIQEQKIIFKRLLLSLAVFIFFHFLISSRHLKLITDCYYYGTIFSIMLVIPLSLLLAVDAGSLKIVNKILLLIFIVIFSSNFYLINKRLIASHDMWYKHFFPEAAQIMPEGGRLDCCMVMNAWENRKDKAYLNNLKRQFPLRSNWLFVEMEYIK